jgi:hypothetical protein
LKLKIEGMTEKAILNSSIAMGKIKNTFIEAAKTATSKVSITGAYEQAASSAMNIIGGIS